MLLEHGLDQRHERAAIGHAVAVGREARIALPLGVLDRAAEPAPELLGEDRHDQVAVVLASAPYGTTEAWPEPSGRGTRPSA